MRVPLPTLRLGVALLALSGLLGSAPLARGEEPERAVEQVPPSTGLVLDGRLEPAWAHALRLPTEEVRTPPRPPQVEAQVVRPDVRVLEQDGHLWIGVIVDEDPGLGIGLRLLVGPEALREAGDAVSIAFAPQELRAARWAVRGPSGAGRAPHVAVEGAADVRSPGVWSLEVALPLAALGPSDGGVRLALAVGLRSSSLVSAVPPGVLFTGPPTWLRLAPAKGAWSVDPEGEAPRAARHARMAEEDRLDEERLAQWRLFLQRSAGLDGSVPTETPADVGAGLLGPLARIEWFRPDLAPWVAWTRSDVLARLGRREEAEAECRAALAALPGCREAEMQLHVKLRGKAWAEGRPGGPSDFAAAVGRAEVRVRETSEGYARDGARLAHGLLLYKQGAFDEAVRVLEPLAKRYPAEPLPTLPLERLRTLADALTKEERSRAREATEASLPRLVLTTTRGPITFDLFEDDAKNAVHHLVWLAEHAFLDGMALHAGVPFFALQAGDPFTKEGAEGGVPGAGGCGYAIPFERSPRLALRGTLAFVALGPDALGSPFLLTTGTALHAREELCVVGRVVDGQATLDQLAVGDRILKATVERRRAGTVYRPRSVAGEPAPVPVPTRTPR